MTVEEFTAKQESMRNNSLVFATYAFPNGMVATFGYDDKQIPELQGVYTRDLHDKIKERSNEKTSWNGWQFHNMKTDMKKRIKWKHNGKEMWCFGEQEGKYRIGLHAHATILVDKDDVIFLESDNSGS